MEDVEFKPTHMDDFLKQLAVEKWRDAIDLHISGNLKECFKAYKSLFHLIEPYEFETQQYLKELTDCVTQYLLILGDKPLNVREVIQFRKNGNDFRELLNIYMSELPKAYKELGLWFKVVAFHGDLDKQLSLENFGDELTTVDWKRKELLKLEVEQLVDLMKPNHIHQIYAKMRVEDAL